MIPPTHPPDLPMLLISLPPIPPQPVATLPDPQPHHAVAIDQRTGEHWYPGPQGWRQLHSTSDPSRLRTHDHPVLQDGYDFADWIAAHGADSIHPIVLPTHLIHLLHEAQSIVRRDATSIGLDDALDAYADMLALCERVHYSIDMHGADESTDIIVYDAPTEKFYRLSRWED